MYGMYVSANTIDINANYTVISDIFWLVLIFYHDRCGSSVLPWRFLTEVPVRSYV